MGNYTNFGMFENPRRDRQARNLTTNLPKILDLKSSSEQIFSKNCRWVPLVFAVVFQPVVYDRLHYSQCFTAVKSDAKF